MSSPVEWAKTHKGLAIGAAAVLAIVGYLAYRRAHVNAAASSGQATSTAGPLTDPSAGGEYLVPYSGDGMGSDNLLNALIGQLGPTPGPTTTTGGVNNNTWMAQAVAWLSGAGYDSLTAQRAIQTYLSGGWLSATDSAEVSNAIKQLGLPPAGAPSPKIGNPPSPATAPPGSTGLHGGGRPRPVWHSPYPQSQSPGPHLWPVHVNNPRIGTLGALDTLGHHPPLLAYPGPIVRVPAMTRPR